MVGRRQVSTSRVRGITALAHVERASEPWLSRMTPPQSSSSKRTASPGSFAPPAPSPSVVAAPAPAPAAVPLARYSAVALPACHKDARFIAQTKPPKSRSAANPCS